VAILTDNKTAKELAGAYGCSEGNIYLLRKKLLKLGAPIIAIQKKETAIKLEKLSNDTNMDRRRYIDELDKLLNGKLSPKEKAFVITAALKALDGMDRAQVIAAHLGGAGSEPGTMEACQCCSLREERRIIVEDDA